MTTHIHLIGIGGSGLSAIARLLYESGYTVSGSDRILSPTARELSNLGIQVSQGHRAQNVTGADIVVRSSAIPDDNPEVLAALQSGIPVYKRSDFMGSLMENHYSIAVAGTHGKTTTTAMIAWILSSMKQDPSYIIGGISKNLGTNAHAGNGKAFVIEADEYDHMFLGLLPDLIVVTYVEHDHPDCYPTPTDYRKAFVDFVHRLKPGGVLLVCRDNHEAYTLLTEIPMGCKALSYGMDLMSDYFARGLALNQKGCYDYEAWYQGDKTPVMLTRVSLQVPGEHNVCNSLAGLAAAHQIGLSPAGAAQAISSYSGTERRFDVRGEACGITIIDDYAHHPTEIQTTLAAARSHFAGRRLWAVWQPHTYTRVQALFNEFSQAFKQADQVLVTEIYAAREKDSLFSAKQVVENMDHPCARFIPTLDEATHYLLQHLIPGDVLLVLSAGDADQISTAVLSQLSQKSKEGKG